MFEDPPPKSDSGSMANQKCLQITVKMLKVAAYLFTFVIVLGSGVIAKGTTLFMTSQLRKSRIIPYCNRDIGKYLTWVRIPPTYITISSRVRQFILTSCCSFVHVWYFGLDVFRHNLSCILVIPSGGEYLKLNNFASTATHFSLITLHWCQVAWANNSVFK